MSFTALVSAISSVGFPIVISLLFYFQSQKNTDKLTEIVINNTKVITELTDKIEQLL